MTCFGSSVFLANCAKTDPPCSLPLPEGFFAFAFSPAPWTLKEVCIPTSRDSDEGWHPWYLKILFRFPLLLVNVWLHLNWIQSGRTGRLVPYRVLVVSSPWVIEPPKPVNLLNTVISCITHARACFFDDTLPYIMGCFKSILYQIRIVRVYYIDDLYRVRKSNRDGESIFRKLLRDVVDEEWDTIPVFYCHSCIEEIQISSNEGKTQRLWMDTHGSHFEVLLSWWEWEEVI